MFFRVRAICKNCCIRSEILSSQFAFSGLQLCSLPVSVHETVSFSVFTPFLLRRPASEKASWGFRLMRSVFALLLLSGMALAQAPSIPIKHVVIMIMENHSFDSIFGTFPGANGATTGNVKGTVIPLGHLPDQPPRDLNHYWYSSQIDIDKGKMDGFAKASKTCSKAPYWCYGQYLQSDL